MSALLLVVKIIAAVTIVVGASRAAERAGPYLGAMIATLPISTGPVYVFLAIDHGAGFIAESARMSVASTAAIAAFVAGHAVAAQRLSTVLSLACGTLAWLAAALLLQVRDWRFVEACAIFVCAFVLAIRSLRRYATADAPRALPRTRYDLALRALLVATVVVATSVAGNTFGPRVTGVLAAYPVVFTCMVVILQPRLGGRFTASVLVTGLKGLIGFGVALAVLHVAAARWHAATALLVALFVSVGWNLVLLALRAWRRRQQTAP